MASVAHVAEERRAAWAVADQPGPAMAGPRVVFEVLAAPLCGARRVLGTCQPNGVMNDVRDHLQAGARGFAVSANLEIDGFFTPTGAELDTRR